MGQCMAKVEVVALEEVKHVIIEELIAICKDRLIPEIIHQLQFTEIQLENLAKDENKNTIDLTKC